MNAYRLYAFADEADPNVDGQIAAMLRNGLQGLEVRNVDGTNVSSITLEKAREVRQKLDDNLAGRRFHDEGVFRILDLGHDISPCCRGRTPDYA